MPVLVSVCLLILFIPGYLTRLLGYPATAVSLTNALCMFAGIPLCLLMGWLADHYDLRLLLGGASAIIAAGAWPLFQSYASGSANLMVMAIAGAVMWGCIEGITLLLVTSCFLPAYVIPVWPAPITLGLRSSRVWSRYRHVADPGYRAAGGASLLFNDQRFCRNAGGLSTQS